MATEDDNEKTEAQAEAASPAKGGGSMKLVIILVAVAVILGGAGAGAYFFLSGGEQSAEAKPEAKSQAPARILNLEMDPFLVNLADPGGAHYLKATLTLELEAPEAADWINARIPRVRDRVLLLLSSKESAELLSAEGKFRLRDDVQRAINDMIGRKQVAAVYLTEFVVQ